MDTTHNAVKGQTTEELSKEAGALKTLATTLGVNAAKAYLPLAILAGSTLGATAGYGASVLKAKNPDIVELERKKRFYDAKVREMTNENWLNDVMALKRRLETERLSDSDRKALEAKYVKLLNRS